MSTISSVSSQSIYTPQPAQPQTRPSVDSDGDHDGDTGGVGDAKSDGGNASTSAGVNVVA